MPEFRPHVSLLKKLLLWEALSFPQLDFSDFCNWCGIKYFLLSRKESISDFLSVFSKVLNFL